MLKLSTMFPGLTQNWKLNNSVEVGKRILEIGPENFIGVMPTGNGFPALFYEDDDGPRTTCPGCHNFICPEDDFCMTCGAPLRETTCPSCGYYVRPGAKFCTKCGKDLLEKK